LLSETIDLERDYFDELRQNPVSIMSERKLWQFAEGAGRGEYERGRVIYLFAEPLVAQVDDGIFLDWASDEKERRLCCRALCELFEVILAQTFEA
jgi:hypothetical protein